MDEDRYVYVFYVDVDSDIIEVWNIVLVGCFEDYLDFGIMFNGKIVMCYIFNDDFVLWGLISLGFRVLFL